MEANEIIKNEEIAEVIQPCAEDVCEVVACNNWLSKKTATVFGLGVVAGVLAKTYIYEPIKERVARRKLEQAAKQKAQEDDANAEIVDVVATDEDTEE